MPRTDGIDVSYWQGTIDWTAVRTTGIWWAATRIWDRQHGPGKDYTFDHNRTGMAFCHYRLLYHFLEGGRSIQQQVDQCLAIVGTLAEGEGMMLDAEAACTELQALAWLHAVEAVIERPCAVYTNRQVDAGRIWNSPQVFNGRPRIFPRYTLDQDVAAASAAPYGWDAWQWSSTGHLPGIVSAVDLDQVDHAAMFDPVCGLGQHELTADDRAWLDAKFAAL
jgi:lysozyme